MRINPKLKNMSKDEIKAWEEKLIELEKDNINKDLTNKIRDGRGWIF